MFFSVPWEQGWTAWVNGKPAEIIKANVGFMAVKVPKGTAEIRFEYKTPGLNIGALVSLLGVLILAIYVSVIKIYDKKHPHKRKTYRIKYKCVNGNETKDTQR